MSESVSHTGTVTQSGNGVTRVRVRQGEGCDQCASKHACLNLAGGEKEIAVATDLTFAVGEEVRVSVDTRYGMRAVWLAFGIPFILLTGSVFTAVQWMKVDEGIAGLIALGLLALYFLILSFFNSRLRRSVKVEIEKL